MNKILVVLFNSESEARAGDQVLKELHHSGVLTVYAAAIIIKDTETQLRVEEKKPDNPLADLFSPLVGSLAGLFGGSLATLGAGGMGVPFGIITGVGIAGYLALIRNFAKIGEREDLSNDIGSYLLPGQAVVVAEVDESQVTPTDASLEAIGGRVFRQTRTDVDYLIFEQELLALQSEVGALRDEISLVSGEEKTRLQAKLNHEKSNLEAKIKQVEVLEDATQQVVEAKVKALQEQMATANDSRKATLQQRADAVVTNADRLLSSLKEVRQKAKAALVD